MTVTSNALRARAHAHAAAAMCAVLGLSGGIPAIASAAERADDAKAATQQTQEQRERKLDAARKRLDEAAREVAELSRSLSEEMVPRMARLRMRHARAQLGINIGASKDEERKDGVEIINVSPGGAAAEAGLRAGDVLVEIKDKSLKQEGSETPREKLLDTMSEVDPEEKVKVRYVRDGKPASATVVARRADTMFSMPLRMERFPSFSFIRSHGAFGSAELVALTPKLGQYFGTDKGLLVVRAPADSRLKLEEGDVLLDIDGRVPTSASHAVRILSSYQAGEKLKLNVMRMKKRATFEITIPEDVFEHRFDGAEFHRFDVEPAVPPAHAAPIPPPPPPPPGSDTA